MYSTEEISVPGVRLSQTVAYSDRSEEFLEDHFSDLGWDFCE